ncbi:MAG: methylmalonyl-CoA decarboxylase [Acidobacteriaceae bacterium]
MSGAHTLVSIEQDGSIGTITMNDAHRLNALSKELIAGLVNAIGTLEAAKVRAIVLRAARGMRTWSSGHNVCELPTNGRDPLVYSDPLRLLIRRIQMCPSPVIAMVEGGVWGGACEVVMSCDFAVASENATFAITPARIGVPYNVAGTLNLMRSANISLVKEMLFCAKPVDAARAHLVGLVNYVVPQDELEEQTYSLTRQIAQNSPMVIALLKEELRVLSAASPLTPDTFERVQGLRRAIYDSEDYQEGIRAFFEKRKPCFQGK